MKRVVTFLLAVCFLMSCAGCAGASGSDDAYTLEAYPSGSAYLNVPAVYETAVTAPTQAEPVTAQMAFTNGENGIDIDLTVLSSTMIYSFVYCMITSPDEYTGMVVKMCGIATSYHNEDTDVWYHACIIQDATACCSKSAGSANAVLCNPEKGKEIRERSSGHSASGTFCNWSDCGDSGQYTDPAVDL